ncbi:hypothetical protein ENSA5_27960 [Enhygromyxa salina]|uniref:Uncharacterized protein n=1 Tax=Enhygromyxa salina TaxID=215803 RepID=A0A2S9Y4H8_9BACT|nr:hypothetical protein ENSA5_27960 [Enhygromyxa salina]
MRGRNPTQTSLGQMRRPQLRSRDCVSPKRSAQAGERPICGLQIAPKLRTKQRNLAGIRALPLDL